MGSIVTLRPNGDFAIDQFWRDQANGDYGGGAGAFGNLRDNNDATYVFSLMGASRVVEMNFDTYTLAANQKCAAMRLVSRIRDYHDNNETFNLDAWLRPVVSGDLPGANYTGPYGGATTVWQNWNYADWSQTAIDAVRALYRGNNSGTTSPKVIESYIDLDIRTQPTVAITSPTTDQKLFSQQPTIYWNYDNKGDTVAGWRFKVFTDAVKVAGGFDPNTSTAVTDSGDVGGSASSTVVGVPLTYGGVYWAYVQIATDFNGTWYRSAWASVRFIVDTPPTVTGVTTTPATPITTTNRPSILFTHNDVDGEASEYCYIRVFSDAQYNAAGFSPNTDSGAAWVSGPLAISLANGAQGSVQSGALSPNVNYKAYVWTSEVGSGQRWSLAPGISGVFVITTAPGLVSDAPVQPEILSVAPDIPNQRVVLSVQARDNMMTRNQASGDTGNIGWEPDANLTQANLVRDTATTLQGGGAYKITPTVNGTTVVMRTTRDASAHPVFPCVAGRTYTATGSARSASTGRNVNVGIRWYTSAWALISTSTGANVADVSTGFLQAFCTAVAPATAVWMEIISTVITPSEAHYWDNFDVGPGSNVVWSRGGLELELGTLSDTFNRADSATTLGNSDGPGTPAWTALAGTWGISGNKAYGLMAATDNFAILTSKYLSDGYVQADITLSPTANRAVVGLLFHVLDINNMMLIELAKQSGVDTLIIYKRVAGTWTALATLTGAGWVNGTTYTIKTEFYGGQINVYVNGTLRLSYLMLTAELNQFGSYSGYGLRVILGATADDGGSRFDNFVAKLPPTQTITIQRSLDGGVTWTNLRNAVGVALNDQLGTFYDYEIPANVLAQYRMKTTASEVASFDSIWSAVVVQSAQLTLDGWWLKDPTDPTLNMKIQVVPPFRFVRKEPQHAYDPLGRKTSVVVTDGQKGIQGSLVVRTTDKATYDKLNTILSNGRPLLLLDILGRSWYVKFGDSQSWEMSLARPTLNDSAPVRHMHTVTMPFEEVAAP